MKNIGNSFLHGGGEMGELTRNYDWPNSTIGAPEQWQQSLRTTLGILLHSAFPMFLFWGEELTCFYNDAFRLSLGQEGKHPALGKRGKEVWPEIWEFIGPLIEQVKTTGEAVWYENQLVPFYRNGRIENIYWTFSYSPAYGDHGAVDGVVVTCTETTKTLNALKQLEDSKENLAFAIEAAELATWDFDPVTNKFTADARYAEWFGLTAEEAADNNLALCIIAEDDRERVIEALAQSLKHSSGGIFDIEYTIRPRHKQERSLRAKGKAWFDEDGTAYRLSGTLQDITMQVAARRKIEESERLFRRLIENSPIATCLLTGRELKIEIINDPMISSSGKDASIIGKPAAEALPELIEQPYLQIMDEIFTSGKPYNAKAAETQLVVDGKPGTYYFDFSYTPMFNAEGEVYGILATSVDVTDKVVVQKQLEESERNLRSLILKAPVAICIFRGPDFVVEIVNERMLESWDKTEEEVLNKPIYQAVPEAMGQGFEALLNKVYTTGETVTAFGAPATLTRNGVRETRYVNLVYDALREGDGSISGIMIVNTDVTEEVLARKKVEESEQQVRALVESAPFPIGVYVGRELRIRFVNQSIIDVWGKGPDLIGKLYTEVLPELENQNILPQLHSVFDTGIPFHARNQRVDLFVDGKLRPFWFNYSFTPLFDGGGKVYGIMNTAADVTDLNIAHRKIEESERNLRNIILQAPVAMCLLKGPDHLVEVANERIIEMWGATGRDVLGKSIFEAVPEVKGQGFETLLDHVYNTGKTWKDFGIPLKVARNGSIDTIYVDFVYEAYKEEEGSISGVMAVAVEVTEQVMARRGIEAVVKERTKELAAANHQLQQNNKELQQFAYIASHDLQEPIRKVTTFTEMLEKSLGPVDERSRNYLNKISSSSRRMLALIRDVLTFSQLSHEQEQFTQVNLADVLENVKSDFELLIEEKQAKINCTSLPVITAIPLQMNQLFSNLISNALKFSKKDVPPVIDITARTLSKEQLIKQRELNQLATIYHIQFSDNGIGFDQENAKQIFDIFRRLHGRSEYEGTGIGLAICKKIAINHNGDLTATSSVNNGATFNIFLPKEVAEP